MLVLLDTHALIWLDQDAAVLGKTARHRADEALKVGELAVSAISFWETAMLAAKDRIEMALSPIAWRRELLSSGLRELPVDGAIGIVAAQLRDFHGDPADRLIVATAQIMPATLITADQQILDWPGKVERFDARR
ncbi:MAG: type II toxin-antitoxin system VapC family toxin [Gammaproteobacteria bacterium]